ncbi:MAG: glycosyltransferase 87 family protein [Streptosporangiaceae bacterium]
MRERIRVTGAALAAAALAAIILLSVRHYAGLAPFQPLALNVGLWPVFGVGAWLVLRVRARRAVPLILLGGIAIQLAALAGPSLGSTDLYRYIWDGRVQAAGIDPYRYAPGARQLVSLREEYLWPRDGQYCVGYNGPTSRLSQVAAPPPGRPPSALAPGCTRINLPSVHTIYPPVAEAYFTAVDELSPANAGSLPIQAAGALCAIATSFLLVGGLRRLGRDPRLAVLWAWCPVVGLQAGNGAHIDVLAAFLTVAALLTLARPGGRLRTASGGLLLGLAIATKITPILAGPAVLRRRPVTVIAAAAGATGVVYLPHLLAVGHRVIGFLPEYLASDGYTNGHRFQLLGLLVPGKWATVAAVAVLAMVGLAVLRRGDPDRPWRGALVMTGAALAVATPSLLWYSMILVALVALDGRAEWLALAAARYFTPTHPLPHVRLADAAVLGYGAAVLIIFAVWLIRRARLAAAPEVTVPDVMAPEVIHEPLARAAEPEVSSAPASASATART